jgi:prepilin-type N-terminal cleavage/methylation domain-containing protein
MNRERRGFTLIELLVVIGNITVLLAILIPVVSRVRLSAQTASTTAEMHRISAAIGNYFNDFQAYPGMTSNQGFANGPKPFNPPTGTYTQSEDLVMALLGGLQFDQSNRIKFVPDQVGLGPISFNTVVVTPRKNAYMEKNAADLTPLQDGAMVPTKGVVDLGMGYASDSDVPEFFDQYATQRPILYLRANPSAIKGNVLYNGAQRFDQTFSYDYNAIKPYLSTKDFGGKAPTDPAVRGYFATPDSKNAVQPVARGAGSYLLLNAGPDRILGTDDDIIVSAGGGQ